MSTTVARFVWERRAGLPAAGDGSSTPRPDASTEPGRPLEDVVGFRYDESTDAADLEPFVLGTEGFGGTDD